MFLSLLIIEELNFSQKILLAILPAVIAIGGVAFAAYLAYKFGVRKLEKDNEAAVRKEQFLKTLNSLEGSWKLCRFTSENENKDSLFVFELINNIKVYSFVYANGINYLNEITQYFYTSGQGLYLPREIRPTIFELRGIVFGLVLKFRNKKEQKIAITNIEMINKINGLHTKLIADLRTHADTISPYLPH